MLETLKAIPFTEWVGYLGSALVLLSFFMKDMRSLRMVSVFGCTCFIVYGVLLHYAVPIIITNVSIIVINVIYLFRRKRG